MHADIFLSSLLRAQCSIFPLSLTLAPLMWEKRRFNLFEGHNGTLLFNFDVT